MKIDPQVAVQVTTALDHVSGTARDASDVGTGWLLRSRNTRRVGGLLDDAAARARAAGQLAASAAVGHPDSTLRRIRSATTLAAGVFEAAAADARSGVRTAARSDAHRGAIGELEALRGQLATDVAADSRHPATSDALVLLQADDFRAWSPDDWHRVAEAAEHTAATGLPIVPTPAAELHATAEALRADPAALPAADWHGWSDFDATAVRSTITTPTEAHERLAALAATRPDQWTARDWHDLQGLAQLPDEVRPAGVPVRRDLAAIGQKVAAGEQVPKDWSGWNDVRAMTARARYPSPAAADAALAKLLATDTDKLGADHFAELSLQAAVGGSLAAKTFDRGHLVDVEYALRNGTPVASKWAGWKQLDELRAAGTIHSRAESTSLADHLLETPVRRLEPAAFHQLQGISSLPKELRPVGFPVRDDYAEVGQRTAAATSGSWNGWFELGRFARDRNVGDMRLVNNARSWIIEHAATATSAGDAKTVAEAKAELGLAAREVELLDAVANVDESWRGNRAPSVDFESIRALAYNVHARLERVRPVLAEAGPEVATALDATIERVAGQLPKLDQAVNSIEFGWLVRHLENYQLYPQYAEIARVRTDITVLQHVVDSLQVGDHAIAADVI